MRIAALLFACASACLAQLDDNTVTVTVTRSVSLQPDQAAVGVILTTPPNTALDDALAALQGVGFSTGDLLFVTTLPPSLTSWQFSKVVPFSALKDALGAVVTAQQNVQKRQGFDLSFFVNAQPSQAAQQSPALCPVPTLFANAQAQAQQVANAAGVRVGGVVSISQGSGPIAIPSAVFRAGDFSQAVIFDPSTGTLPVASFGLLGTVAPSASGCALTVQFNLLR